MRTTTTQEAKVLAGRARSNYIRVKTKNAAGSTITLTALRGYNWVKSATWSEAVDNYVQTAEVDLQRENGHLSLSNMMAGSVLNSGGPLIEIGRELTIETATMPLGIAPGSSDWHLVFHGYVDNVAWESTPIKVTARDLAGQLLQDAQIEVDQPYGQWAKSRDILTGFVNTPSGNPPNGQPSATQQFWRCTTPGTTGTSEPAWPASPSPGATQSDGSVVWTYQAAVAWSAASARVAGAFTANPANTLQYWQCIVSGNTGASNPFPSAPTQGQVVVESGGAQWQYFASLSGTPAELVIQSIINDTLGAGVVTLNVPTPSNWFLEPYVQNRDKLFSAISTLSESMGWDLRFCFTGSESTGDFQLTLQQVARGAPFPTPSVVWTFGPSTYFDVTALDRDITDVRNAVQVIFPDREHLDPTTGQPTRGVVQVDDSASETAYKRRAMEVAEDSTGSLTTLAMATQFANAALADLKEPLLAAELTMPYFWAIQLNDYVTLAANGVHLDADTSVAVVSIKQTFDVAGADGSGTERTVLGLRALPSGGAQKHLDKEAGAASPVYSLATPVAASGLVVTPTLAGMKFQFAPSRFAGSKYLVPELHVSASPSFTAGAATLKDSGVKSAHVANDLTPGNTYYAAIVMRDQRGGPSLKSKEISFVAGYANLGISGTTPLHVLNPNLTQNGSYFADTQPTFTAGTDFVAALDSQDFGSPDLTFDAVNHTVQFAFAADAIFNFRARLTQVTPGDAARLVLQKLPNGAFFWLDIDSSPIATVISDVPNGVDQIELAGSFGEQVAALDKVRLVVRSYPASGTPTWKMSIHSSGFGAALAISQTLVL